jgi:hypothetical protein
MAFVFLPKFGAGPKAFVLTILLNHPEKSMNKFRSFLFFTLKKTCRSLSPSKSLFENHCLILVETKYAQTIAPVEPKISFGTFTLLHSSRRGRLITTVTNG